MILRWRCWYGGGGDGGSGRSEAGETGDSRRERGSVDVVGRGVDDRVRLHPALAYAAGHVTKGRVRPSRHLSDRRVVNVQDV